MRYITLVIIALLSLTSCQKKTITCFDENKEYHFDSYFHTGSIQLVQREVGDYYAVRNGNKTVFSYDYGYIIPNTNDADWSSRIVFQVDSGVTSFNYYNAELEAHNTYYDSWGGWGGEQYALNKGFIKGHMISDGVWQIEMHIELKQTDNVLRTATIVQEEKYTYKAPDYPLQ